MRAIRWGDNDRYFGPITWAPSDHYRTLAITFRSRGDDDEESGQASFRLSLGYYSLLIALPNWVVRPERKRIQARYWSPQDIERMGRDWYWEVTPREYGISINDGHLSIRYGRETHDSSTEQRWGCFLPWTQWRFIRHSFYDTNGEHFWTIPNGMKWSERRAIQEKCPTIAFDIEDFDGTKLVATTKIEEREWRFGEGWFKWLSIFRRPMIKRTLDISLSDETGPEKGSWKGGMIGTGIEMLPGELHEAAFRRFCDQEHRSKYRKYRVKFLGRALPLTTD